MLKLDPPAQLNPVRKRIASLRQRRRAPGARPMGYLFDRVRTELEQRIAMTGCWGEINVYLGFQGEGPLPTAGWASRCSLLEEDCVGNLVSPCDLLVFSLQCAWFHHEEWLDLALGLLRPGGKLVFASLGPDTLVELSEAWQRVDPFPHVHEFVDMHHLGDSLVKRGFGRPILDADWMGVEYEDLDLLMDDLRSEGFYNVMPGRRRTLMGGQRLKALHDQFRNEQPIRSTFEIIYGYAEAPAPRDGIIRVEPPGL